MVQINASVEMGDSIRFFYKIFELFKENDDSKSNDDRKVRRRKPLRNKKDVKVKQIIHNLLVINCIFIDFFFLHLF